MRGQLYVGILSILPGVVATTPGDEMSRTSLWPAEACTDKSFSIPSWTVQVLNFTDDDLAHFTLTNRVTEMSSVQRCSLADGTCTATKGSGVRVTARLTNETIQIYVEDSWICSDKKTLHGEPKTIHFESEGNTTVAVNCERSDDDILSCTPTRHMHLIKGSLTAPIQLEMSPPHDRATSSKSPSCQAVSGSPSWELINIDYWNNTYGNMWAGPQVGRGMNIDIVNSESGDAVQCRALFSIDPHEAPTTVTMQCWRDAYASWQEGEGTGQLWTMLTFDEETHDVVLNQTWFCEDPASLESSAVSAIAVARLPLNCTVADYGEMPNPVTLSGDTIPNVQTHCKNDSVVLTGEITSRETLPPFSIEDPYPTTGGCTVDSIVAPYFKIHDFNLNITTGAEERHEASMSFLLDTLSEYMTGVTLSLNVSSTPDVPNSLSSWHNCSSFLGWRLPECQFKFDFDANSIEVRQDWICLDKGNAAEIGFSGSGMASLPPLDCSEGKAESVCTLTALDGDVIIEPSSVEVWNL